MGTTTSACAQNRGSSPTSMKAPPPGACFPLSELASIPGVGAQIMRSLPLAERVRLRATCRLFCSLVDESLALMPHLSADDLAGIKKEKRTEALLWLASKCPNLTSIATKGGQRLTLPEVDIGYQTYDNTWARHRGPSSVLLQLAVHCQRLRSIDVSYSHGVTDESIQAIARSCSNLEALTVTHCYRLSDKGVRAVAGSCPRLETLDVSLCKGVTDASIMAIVSQGAPLRCFKASFCDSVSDASIKLLAERCPELRHLAVPNCHGVTDASIRMVANHCCKLQHLDVGFCPGVTDASVMAIGAWCPELTYLSVEECHRVGDCGIVAVASNCRQLKHLNVASTSKVTAAGIRAVGEKCSQLQHLAIRGHTGKIGDVGMLSIALGCPDLRHLYAESCADVTDESMRVLATRCHQLQVLCLQHSYNVTDVSIIALSEHCHALEELGLEGCPGVSDASIRLIAGSCPRLRVLAVAGAVYGNRVTNESLKVVADKCEELVQLGVSNTNVEDATLLRIAQRGKLTVLDVAWCKRLSRRFFKKLGRSCPGLEVLNASGCMLTWEQLQTSMQGSPQCRLRMQRSGVV